MSRRRRRARERRAAGDRARRRACSWASTSWGRATGSRGDWTKTRLYWLSATTRKLVAGLTKPVRVTVFMDRDSRL